MPSPEDLTRLYAHEQSSLLRAGELTSRELTEAHLAGRFLGVGEQNLDVVVGLDVDV